MDPALIREAIDKLLADAKVLRMQQPIKPDPAWVPGIWIAVAITAGIILAKIV